MTEHLTSINCDKNIKKNNKKTNHIYLQYTSLLPLISLFYFLFKIQNTKQPNFEYVLAFFLMLVVVFSQLFWSNPIKGSTIHKTDAIIAKIAILVFSLYTFIYKFKFSYLLVLFAVVISFYLSNYHSNQEWCSDKHLLYHGSLHIFCFIGTFYAFIQV